MSINFKKKYQRKMTYIPDDIDNHKHNYILNCVLEITNKNIHASAGYYNSKEYYNVLKCNMCNSFIPNSVEGNYSGNIFNKDFNKDLPLIKANTFMKCPAYHFDNLKDIYIKEKN